MIHNCNNCAYKTPYKANLKRHMENKHVTKHGGRAPTSILQPTVGYYSAKEIQTGSGVSQNVDQPSGQNVYQAEEVNACFRQWQEAYRNMGARYKQLEKDKAELIQYSNAQSSRARAPTTISIGPNHPKAPSTVSVPPLGSTDQYGSGANMELDNESVESDDNEEITPDINDILTDISSTFTYLKHLRKQYRKSLPQIKEFDDKEMDEFLEYYSLIKTDIIEDRDGLEATVTQRGRGIDDSESEGETDEESVDDPDEDTANDVDSEGETDEEAVDDSDEDTANDVDTEDTQEELDYTVKFDKVDENETNKEYFFDFVLEAENFLDEKSKKMVEKYVTREKKDIVLADAREQDETDMPEDMDDILEDIEHVIDLWNKREEECFKKCGKRKIMSLSNIANCLMDTKSLEKMKKMNPSKFHFIQKMLRPHKKALEKLINSKISVHEKRKVLQKSQVGGDILDAAANLVIPTMEYAKKRKIQK